eukprot:403368386
MYNFEGKDAQHKQSYHPIQTQQSHNINHLTQSNYSDFPMTSPNPHDVQSFMTSSGGPSALSPLPHQIRKYTGEEQSPNSNLPHHVGHSSEVLQDFRTPPTVNNHHQISDIQHLNMGSKVNYHLQHHQSESPVINGAYTKDNNMQSLHLNGKFQINQQRQQPPTTQTNNFIESQRDPLSQPRQIQESQQQMIQQNTQNQQQHSHGNSQNLKSTFYHQNQNDLPLKQQQVHASQIQDQAQNLQKQQSNMPLQSQTNNQMLINNLDLDRLRQIMKEQYRQYSEDQIEQYLQKFLREYLAKVTQQHKQSNNLDEMFSTNTKEGDQSDSSSDDDQVDEKFKSQDFNEDQEDPSRDSLSTNLDWNDKGEIEKYCVKQKRIQEKKDFRPSQYFGAIKVDQLADGIDDSRIDELFSDVFGIKPKKQKRIGKEIKRKESQNVPEQQLLANNFQLNDVQQNPLTQIQQNDQQCKIVLNIYNQYQFMNQQDTQFKQGQQQNPQGQKQQQQNIQQEDQFATVLQEKSNQNCKKATTCQILHQEQQNYNMMKQKSMQQDQLKKYMSPAELNKLKHQKNTSESIELENNDFQKCCFKTDDNRAQQVLLSSKGLSAKSYQTQVSSPQSQATIHRHLYNQSITSSNNLGINQSIQSLTHQSSHGNLNSTGGIGFQKTKHHSNLSLNKQAYKSIIYKNHHSNNSNFNSISSQHSLDNKPKQNKLSYLVAKNLPEGQSSQEQNHSRIHSSNGAPKPPQNQSLPITQKMGRDSKDSNKQPYNYVPHSEQATSNMSEHSPQVSPKSLLYKQNQQNAPSQVNNFKLNSQTFSMQHANSTFQNQKPAQMQQSQVKDSDSQSKTLVQQATENFRKAKQSVQLSQNLSIYNEGSATQRTKNQKTLGRNQSQNLFLSQNQINTSVNSFLMSSGDINKNIQKDLHKNKVQYLDTEEVQNSPKIFNNQYDQAYMSNTTRPQTAINTNFSLATGINNYVNAAQNLGKPPSKLQKAGFLSHNSSVKNLKIQTNGNMTLTQTAQNSQRKLKANLTSVQDEFLAQTMPNSTRHANVIHHTKLVGQALDFTSKERDHVTKPATTKSIDRNKLKSSMIQQQYENDLASIERKKQLIQQHSKFQTSQENTKQGPSKHGEKKMAQLGRNQSGISKGKSANHVSEFISNFQTQKAEPTKTSDSQSRMMLKITKSIEKISQQTKSTAAIQKGFTPSHGLSIVSSPTNQNISSKTFNFPQSTKNSSKNQISDMMNQLTSYQNYKKTQVSIGKQSHEKENMLSSTGDLRNMKSQKGSMLNGLSINSQHVNNQGHHHTGNANSKTRKDAHQNGYSIDQNTQGKKTAETFKRYLTTSGGSNLQSHLKSFK